LGREKRAGRGFYSSRIHAARWLSLAFVVLIFVASRAVAADLAF